MAISSSLVLNAPPEIAAWERAVRPSGFGIVPLVYAGVKALFAPQSELEGAELLSSVIDTGIRQMVERWNVGHPEELVVFPLKDSPWKTLADGRDRKGALDVVTEGEYGVLVNKDNGRLHCVVRRSGVLEYAPRLQARLYTSAAGKEFNRPTRVRASSVSGCQRATFFDISRFAAVDVGRNNPHWRCSAAIGTEIHNILEAVLESMPLKSQTEYSVEIPGVFGGKVDGRVEVAGEQVLLDWKTIGNADFRQGTGLTKIEKYFAQLSSYAAVEGVTKAVVILVNRNTGALEELELVLDTAYGAQLIQRARTTMQYVAQKVVPQADKLGSRECFFCQFARQCNAEVLAPGSTQYALDTFGRPEDI